VQAKEDKMGDTDPETMQQGGQEATSCHTCGSTERSRKRWNDSRHAKMIEVAVELVKTGSPELDAAWMRSYWDNFTFKSSLLAGLHDADYKYPYDAFIYSSHFYDPDSGENYQGFRDKTAKTEALRYFKESLAIRFRDPNAISDMAYNLGLALHYLTDISQPMHAANHSNMRHGPDDWNHSGLEEYAEMGLEKYNQPPYADTSAIDNILAGVNSTEQLVENLARFSKSLYVHDLQPLLSKANRGKGDWDSTNDRQVRTDMLLLNAISSGERTAAAFLLLWIRGYESIIDRLYHRFFDRTPDAGGKENYLRHLVKDNYTVRDIVREMASSSEYCEHNRRLAASKRTTPREVLFADVFNEKPTATQHPTEEEMKQGLNHTKWFDLVNKMVKSGDYSRRFSEHQIPGYRGISVLKS
jgi:hypothetical protein